MRTPSLLNPPTALFENECHFRQNLSIWEIHDQESGACVEYAFCDFQEI